GYAHMSGFASGLSNGRKVRQGDVIGYVGSTGRSTGAHLHFEVYEDGERIDPYQMQALNEGSTGEGYFAEDSAGGSVALKTGGSKTADDSDLSFFETANQTIAIAGDTLAVATESVIAMAEDLARSDTGRQITAWGGQARDAFEKEVLTPLDLEKLFDGFGEEAADVSAD
ncbi:MAG: M23 family metallopeptidase, partial [Pseudomonadota bacterium]